MVRCREESNQVFLSAAAHNCACQELTAALKLLWLDAKLLQLGKGQLVAHLCQLCLQMQHIDTVQPLDTEALLSATCCRFSGLLQQ